MRNTWKTKSVRRDSTRERHWGGVTTVAPSGEGLVEVKRAGGKGKMGKRGYRDERYEAEATRSLGLGVDFTKVDRFVEDRERERGREGTSMLHELMSLEVSLA